MKQKNKVFLFLLSIILYNTSSNARDNCHSHSIFIPRNITTNSTFELALNNYHWFHEREINECYNFGIYITPFFQQTTNPKKITRYFLHHNQECLTFNEINENPCGIESLWFGLISDLDTNFTGTFTMCPRRRNYGSYINSYLSIKLCDQHRIWANIAFAAMTANHELNLCEQTNELLGPLSNFALGTINESTSINCALNNPAWRFGKFSQCNLKKSGVDDIQVKIGYSWFYCEEYNNHISPYLVGTIPTGKHQRSEFIFEPIVGSKHGSLGLGLNTDYSQCICDDQFLTLLFDIKYLYYFSAFQCRSFDLCKNGDWSRYLLLINGQQTLLPQPGINFLTLNAEVHPRSTINLWAAAHWQWCNYNLEIGYNFWWRQKETVRLKKGTQRNFAVFDLSSATDVPITASTANISQGPIGSNQVVGDASFISLGTSDLDFNSAAHPTAQSSTFYGSLGLHPILCGKEFLFGLGAQYEFGHNDAALSQWAVWIKLGIIL